MAAVNGEFLLNLVTENVRGLSRSTDPRFSSQIDLEHSGFVGFVWATTNSAELAFRDRLADVDAHLGSTRASPSELHDWLYVFPNKDLAAISSYKLLDELFLLHELAPVSRAFATRSECLLRSHFQRAKYCCAMRDALSVSLEMLWLQRPARVRNLLWKFTRTHRKMMEEHLKKMAHAHRNLLAPTGLLPVSRPKYQVWQRMIDRLKDDKERAAAGLEPRQRRKRARRSQ
jgi:hypothetical protein